MTLNKGDFIELDYVARMKESNQVFDLTKKDVAEKEGIFNSETEYKPAKICLGYRDVIKGVDEFLIGKDINKDYIIEVKIEDGFGKKNPKLIKLVPTNLFAQQNIKPVPGLHVNLDGLMGTIKTVSGGRTIVDFNHPLSGHDLKYEVKVVKIITDLKEKISSILNHAVKDYELDVKDSKLTIKAKLSDNLKPLIIEEIKKKIPEIKEIDFKN
ncbi:peptidylprolyl isomerase [archaeon]|nr:peptidylprolyl isomerase [archaeon]